MRQKDRIFCNMCGREIECRKDIPVEEVLSVKKQWGYFSKQDGLMYEFDLCETCCGELINKFRIPAMQTEKKELL